MIDSRPASDGHERPRAAARAWADLHDVEIRDSGPSTGTEVVLAYFDCMAGEEMPNVRLHRVSGCKPPLLRHQAGTDPDVLAGSRTPPYRIPSVSRPARCRSCRTLPPSTRGGLRAMRRKATRRMLTHGNVYAAPLARPGGRSPPAGTTTSCRQEQVHAAWCVVSGRSPTRGRLAWQRGFVRTVTLPVAATCLDVPPHPWDAVDRAGHGEALDCIRWRSLRSG